MNSTADSGFYSLISFISINSTAKLFHFTFYRLKHAHADIKKKQADLKKTEASYKKDSTAYEQVKANMEKLKVNAWLLTHMMKIGSSYKKEGFSSQLCPPPPPLHPKQPLIHTVKSFNHIMYNLWHKSRTTIMTKYCN